MTPLHMNKSIISLLGKVFLFTIALCITDNASAQNLTSVKGQALDAQSNDPLPYINIQFDGTTIGTTSDIDGNFYLETKEKNPRLKVSYVGYKTQIINIKAGQTNQVTVKMTDASVDLNEVVIHQAKYRNKGNPAVELIKKVIENKDKNRKEGFNFYNYQKYEKVEFALNNITDGFRKNFLFRNMKFLFANVDTNKASGKVNLPFFLRETASDVFYRKAPKAQKEYIHGEKSTVVSSFLDQGGLTNYIDNMYRDINFYDNTVDLATVAFVSPISPLAPNLYRFYIQDTSKLNEKDTTQCVHLYFAPREKSDIAFMGHLWVAISDSSYAVRKIEVGVPKDINLNWINELQLIQEYDWVESYDSATQAQTTPSDPNLKSQTSNLKSHRGLMLTKDEIFMDFGLTQGDKSRSMLGRKSTSYRNYEINKPLSDSLFKDGAAKIIRDDDSEKREEIFWTQNRHDTLSAREKGVYKTIDTLVHYKPFTKVVGWARFLLEGYTPIGGFNIGPANTFYSFNEIEGFRGRLGGLTNSKFSKKIVLDGYAAYGFKDQRWKGYAGARFNFTKDIPNKFPIDQLKVWYLNDIKIPGQELQFVNEDNFLLSFKRGVNNKMIYNTTVGVQYEKETNSGFSYNLSFKNTILQPAGALKFDYDLGDRLGIFKPNITTTQAGISLRYAPNEQFYQGVNFRTPILNRSPIIELDYTAGIKGVIESEYNYHSLHFKVEQIFYPAPFGIADVIIEGGRIFGNVPYPLLTAHRANQTYAYQMESYNLMNFLEFVSDKYASVNIQWNFGGILFNRVPLLKKLKWREVLTFKSIWGGLDDSNVPSSQNGLLKFPVDENGKTTTFTLAGQPYMEASVGVANIFKFFRLDYVRRLNYLDHPNVSASGIRARIKLDF